MIKFIKNNYLFLILFLIILLKDPLYRLISLNKKIYNTLDCHIIEDNYNKLLEFNQININYNLDYINTIIIYKDIYNYLNEITIRGGLDQQFDNNPVIYDNTLIGLINKVNKTTSIVQLLTNKKSKISVKINE